MDIERYKLLNPVSDTYLNDEKVKLGLSVVGKSVQMNHGIEC